MNTLKLASLTRVSSTADIARLLGISQTSARVTATRYVKRGILVRLKRDAYLGAAMLPHLTERQRFDIANHLVVPSYISLATVLSHADVSTQQIRGIVESIALKRSTNISAGKLEFRYLRIRSDLYNGFHRSEGVFIASPEKALVDTVYLVSHAKYSCDFDAIDFRSIQLGLVENLLLKTNDTALNFWKNLCKTYKLSKRSKSKFSIG